MSGIYAACEPLYHVRNIIITARPLLILQDFLITMVVIVANLIIVKISIGIYGLVVIFILVKSSMRD